MLVKTLTKHVAKNLSKNLVNNLAKNLRGNQVDSFSENCQKIEEERKHKVPRTSKHNQGWFSPCKTSCLVLIRFSKFSRQWCSQLIFQVCFDFDWQCFLVSFIPRHTPPPSISATKLQSEPANETPGLGHPNLFPATVLQSEPAKATPWHRPPPSTSGHNAAIRACKGDTLA